MKIRNWEMLRNEWTLEGLACNAGKTAISMRSLMSGIFSCNPYQFLDTTLWEHVRNVSVDFRNMSHMSMICKQQQQQLPWLHSQGCEWIVVASDTPKIESLVFGYVSWPDVGEQSEYLKKIIPARGPRKDLCVVVVTTSQLSGKSDGDGYSNDVIQNLSIRLFERTWVLTSGHQTTDVCDVSHQNGTHLDRNWSNMLSLGQTIRVVSNHIRPRRQSVGTWQSRWHVDTRRHRTRSWQVGRPRQFFLKTMSPSALSSEIFKLEANMKTGKNKKGWAKFSKVYYKRYQTIKQQDWYMNPLPLDTLFFHASNEHRNSSKSIKPVSGWTRYGKDSK